jgi:hypothetical protein
MASQAKECSRLPEQVVCHGPVRFMTNRTVLAHRRMLDGKWPLLFSMALVAQQVNTRFLEVAGFLAVSVVAVGAHHFSFLDGMVRWQRI